LVGGSGDRRGTEDLSGGHKRSRTSDPYSVNVVRTLSTVVYCRLRVPILERFRDFDYSTVVYQRLLVTIPMCVVKYVTRQDLVLAFASYVIVPLCAKSTKNPIVRVEVADATALAAFLRQQFEKFLRQAYAEQFGVETPGWPPNAPKR
jgi:hypothetical protein